VICWQIAGKWRFGGFRAWKRPGVGPGLTCGFCVEPPAGIEPATPSLPWNHREPLCEPPFPQVTLDRSSRSYRFSFGEVTKGYGSSWIFWLGLTCASALRPFQYPGFSLVCALLQVEPGLHGCHSRASVSPVPRRPSRQPGTVRRGGRQAATGASYLPVPCFSLPPSSQADPEPYLLRQGFPSSRQAGPLAQRVDVPPQLVRSCKGPLRSS
jgi:hypothetical protein